MPCALSAQIVDVGIDVILEAPRVGHRPVLRAIDIGIGIVPNEHAGVLRPHSVRIDAVVQALHLLVAVPHAPVQAHPAIITGRFTVLGILSVQGVLAHGFRSKESFVPHQVRTQHHIPLPETLGVEEVGARHALVAALVHVRRFVPGPIVHAREHVHPGGGLFLRIGCAHVDHPAQGRAAVKHGGGTFDHFQLLQVLRGDQRPRGTAYVTAQHG